MSGDNIQIAIRVRPFNQREEGENCIIDMKQLKNYGTVFITDPEDSETKEFKYNHTFWSHDDKNGKSIFTNSELHSKIGIELLENAYQGFNSTVFAYGQTGSGKSYSIEGIPSDEGLLQRVCESLFKKKDELKAQDDKNDIVVNVSYLEIYNENLRDLLDSSDKNLKIYSVRNSIIVKNLSKVP